MIHLAAASSLEYLPWCATMIRSVLDHHAPALHVHYLDGIGLPANERARLESMVRDAGAQITVHEIGAERLAGLPPHERFGGLVVWLRLLLPELLPDLERVLYVDADAFAADSLQSLWDSDLGGAPLGAVGNVVEPEMWPHLTGLGIADPRDVLNSGVLLMDLRALRAEDALGQVRAAVRRQGDRMTWADQDALNVVFDGRWHHLHPRWNAQNSLWTWSTWAADVFGADVVAEARARPAIVHFEGPHVRKPWHFLCQHPARGAYRDARARTPWGPAALEDRTLLTRAISRLPEQRQVPTYIRLLRLRRRRRRLRAALGRVRRRLRQVRPGSGKPGP